MRLFWFERVRTFTIVSADNDCFLHANIARYYFLVTNANSTLVFHKRVNWIRADESSPLVPTRCLLSFVSNGSLILLFFSYGSKCNYSSQVISYCSRILNKKETFISGRYLRLSSSSLFIFNEHLIYGIFFSPILLKLLKCSLKTAWDQVKCNLIKSDFQRVRGFSSVFLLSVK